MENGENRNEEERSAVPSGWDKLKMLVFRPKERPLSDSEAQAEPEEEKFFGEDPYKVMHEKNAAERRGHESKIENARDNNRRLANEIENQREYKAKVQRTQEMIERDINSRIMTAQEMYENEGAEKRTIPYCDGEVEVIDMKGAPYRLLVTAIDFKKDSINTGAIGRELAAQLVEDPSIWDKNRSEVEGEASFNKQLVGSKSDTISTSYINSDTNSDTFVTGEVVYGFDHIRPDSLLQARYTDGNTSNNIGTHETFVTPNDANYLKKIEDGATLGYGYNEIQLRRYDEHTGEPLKPSYLIVVDNKITEAVLKHASYWGVPIININRGIYSEMAREKGEDIANSIDENTDFIELEKKLGELMRYHGYEGYKDCDSQIGRGGYGQMPDYELDRQKRILAMEAKKAVEYMKSTLEGMTSRIESDTEKGLVSSCSEADYGLKRLDLELVDEYGDRHRRDYSENAYSSVVCKTISLSMTLAESPLRPIKFDVYDGERTQDGSNPYPNADSSYYDELEPAVLRYIDAYRKNQALKESLAA